MNASNMVVRPRRSKSSNAGTVSNPSYYGIKGLIRYCGFRPTLTKVDEASAVVAGTLGDQPIEPARWKEPPHRFLVNLPCGTAGASTGDATNLAQMLMFIKTYGPPKGVVVDQEFNARLDEATARQGIGPGHRVVEPDWAKDLTEPRFYVNAQEFSQAQNLLRDAWEGASNAQSEIRAQVLAARFRQRLQLTFPSTSGVFQIVLSDLWSFMCVLFLRDLATGKTGKCANPDCPAPYFLKRRKTQRVCELGPCAAWAQRQYAMRWWNTKGKKRREKK